MYIHATKTDMSKVKNKKNENFKRYYLYTNQ